jgi:hypothetical protein
MRRQFSDGNDEAGRFSHKYASKMEPGDKNAILNPGTFEPFNGYKSDRETE